MPTLVQRVRLDSSGVRSGVSDMGRSTGRIGGMFGGIAKMAALAGGAIAAVGIAAFAKKSIDAAEEAQTAQTRFNASMAASGLVTKAQAANLSDYASAMQTKVAFDDESIRTGIANLSMFKLTGNQLKTLTPLVIDYAARTGQDVPDAAKNIGRALLGNTRALKAVGIEYKATGDRAKDAAAITDLLRSKVGGYAVMAGKTAAGQTAILRNQFEELKETIGAGLLPAVTSFTSGLNKVMPNITKTLAPAMKQIGTQLSRVFGAIMPAIGRTLTGLAPLIAGFVSAILPILTAIGKAFGALAPTLAPLGAMLAKVGQVFASMVPVFTTLLNAIVPLVPPLLKIANVILGALVGAFREAAPLISRVIGILGHGLLIVLRTLQPVIITVVRALGAGLIQVLHALAPSLPALGKAFAQLAQAFGQLLIAALPMVPPLVQLGTVLLRTIGVAAIMALAQTFTLLAKALTPIAPILPPLIAGLIALKVVSAVTEGVRAMYFAWKAMPFLLAHNAAAMRMISAATTVWNAVTSASTAVWHALTAAMASNPIGIIVVAVVALAAAFYLAYTKIKPFHDAVNAVARTVANAAKAVIGALQPAIEFIGRNWKVIAGLLLAPFITVPILIATHLRQIGRVVASIGSRIGQALGSLGSVFAGWIAGGVRWLITNGPRELGKGLAWLALLPLRIVAALGRLDIMLLRWVGVATLHLASALPGLFVRVLRFFVGLPGMIVRSIGKLDLMLLRVGVSLLTGLLRGLTSALPSVIEFLASIPARMQDAFSALADIGMSIIGGLVEGLTGALPGVLGFFLSIPARVLGALGNVENWLFMAGGQVISGFVSGLGVNLGVLGSFFARLPGRITSALSNAGAWLVITGRNVLAGFLTGVQRGAAAVFAFFTRIPSRILRGFANINDWLVQPGLQLLMGLLRGIGHGEGAVFRFILSLPGRIQNAVSGAATWLLNTGRSVIAGFLDGQKRGWTNIVSWLRGLPGRILDALANAGRWLLDIGKQVIEGFKNGVEDAARGIGDWVADKLNPVNAVKGLLGIGSPSRVMADIGRDTANGFRQGAERQAITNQGPIHDALLAAVKGFHEQDAIKPGILTAQSFADAFNEHVGNFIKAGASVKQAVSLFAGLGFKLGPDVSTQRATTDALLSMKQGYLDLRDALKPVPGLIDTTTGSLNLNSRAGLEARRQLSDQVEQVVAYAQAVVTQTGSVDKGSASLQENATQMANVAVQAGMSRTKADQLVATLFGIPREKATNIHNNAQLAQAVARTYLDTLELTPHDKTTTFHVGINWAQSEGFHFDATRHRWVADVGVNVAVQADVPGASLYPWNKAGAAAIGKLNEGIDAAHVSAITVSVDGSEDFDATAAAAIRAQNAITMLTGAANALKESLTSAGSAGGEVGSGVTANLPSAATIISNYAQRLVDATARQADALRAYHSAWRAHKTDQADVQTFTGKTARAYGVLLQASQRLAADTARGAPRPVIEFDTRALRVAQDDFKRFSGELTKARKAVAGDSTDIARSARTLTAAQRSVRLASNVANFTRALRSGNADVRHFQHDLETLEKRGFTNLARTLAEQGPEVAGALAAGFAKNTAKAKLANATLAQQKVVTDSFNSFLGRLTGSAAAGTESAGNEVAAGLIKGIVSFIAQSGGTLSTDVVNKIKSTIEELFGISSPSKWAMTVGERIGDGLVRGLRAKRKDAAAAFSGLLDGNVVSLDAARAHRQVVSARQAPIVSSKQAAESQHVTNNYNWNVNAPHALTEDALIREQRRQDMLKRQRGIA